MKREEAIAKISSLEGQDLRALAGILGVTVRKNGKINKGWAGHTIERYLGLPQNSSRAPNFGSWELKVIPLIYRKRVGLRVKETMAITMLDPVEVKLKPFEESHLFSKISKILVVSRVWESPEEKRSVLHSVASFDLKDGSLLATLRADYDLIRNNLHQGIALSGTMGQLIQPRTKGPGHGSTSRAFYARTKLVERIVGIETSDDT